MDHIWAPWRMDFILGDKPSGCILCMRPLENDDRANLILFRSQLNFIILNKYPYNPGHIMVAPYRHIPDLADMTPEEMVEHFELVRKITIVLRQAFSPAAFNIGLNIGKVAGAGIGDHIHSHIVPRWSGDTNFMPVVADTRVLPESLLSTYDKLKDLVGRACCP